MASDNALQFTVVTADVGDATKLDVSLMRYAGKLARCQRVSEL